MIGAIIGDIVGSTREWDNIKTEEFELVPLNSRFTDDTVMTVAVAKWLVEDPEHHVDTLVRCMQSLGRKYPNAGYGGLFRKWLCAADPQPYNSFGNGSAMRVSPVGLYAKSLEETLELARITAMVSHNHPSGIKGAQAIAAAVFLKKSGSDAAEIKEYIENTFGYNLDEKLENKRPTYTFDVTCDGSVPVAIMAYLQRPYSVEGALRLAISMGGDSDTIGCMTAAIATVSKGCVFNPGDLPEGVVERCRAILTDELREIVDDFVEICNDSMPADSIDLCDRVRGSLIAGAAGDALGYAVEFMSRGSILDVYGQEGITRFDMTGSRKAQISDDTQMTLFTADGLLMGIETNKNNGSWTPLAEYVGQAYLDWYYTQSGRKNDALNPHLPHSWLRDLPDMAHSRAPGNTCMSACASMLRGHEAQNNSKGCGGIMRAAPVGLIAAAKGYSGVVDIMKVAAKTACLTHKHPLGYMPAALLAHLVYHLVKLTPEQARLQIDRIVENGIGMLDQVYLCEYTDDKRVLADLTRSAMLLAHSDVPDHVAIRRLGEGWVGEEAWAIALYCAVRHIDSTRDAIIASVNHSGDSDSTGSICGNIMGAIYGYEALKKAHLFCPDGKKLEDVLELHDTILFIADSLSN